MSAHAPARPDIDRHLSRAAAATKYSRNAENLLALKCGGCDQRMTLQRAQRVTAASSCHTQRTLLPPYSKDTKLEGCVGLLRAARGVSLGRRHWRVLHRVPRRLDPSEEKIVLDVIDRCAPANPRWVRCDRD